MEENKKIDYFKYIGVATVGIIFAGVSFFVMYHVTRYVILMFTTEKSVSKYENVTQKEMDSARIYMNSNPENKKHTIKVCVDEAKKNSNGVLTDYQIEKMCTCGMERIASGSNFDDALESCLRENL